MGKLQPERFELVFLYKYRRGFFFGNKILGWIDHLSPGARAGGRDGVVRCVGILAQGADEGGVLSGRVRRDDVEFRLCLGEGHRHGPPGGRPLNRAGTRAECGAGAGAGPT